MITQDPVSVSVIAFLVIFAVGTAWLMVGRQAMTNAGRNAARAGKGASGGVLIGLDPLHGASANELNKNGHGRSEFGKRSHQKGRAGRTSDKSEVGLSKPAESLNEAGVDEAASGPVPVGGKRQLVSNAGPSAKAAVRFELAPSQSVSEVPGRAGRPVPGRSSPLSVDQQWSRITEIVRGEIESAERADSFHAAANQQLDAVDYAIARLREEMESISAGGGETTRRREPVSRPNSQSERSGFVPLLGAGERDAVAQVPSGPGGATDSQPDAELVAEFASIREGAPAKLASGQTKPRRRGKAKRSKEKSIAA